MTRSTCEESRRLDAAEFARKGWLRPNLPGWSSWRRGDQPSGSISWHSHGSRLELSYTVTDWCGEKHDYRYSVAVERMATPFGGERTWWRCPNTRCGRRVQILYQPPGGRHFLCRRCHDLAYRSQQDRHAKYWKAADRQREVEQRLASGDLTPRERWRLIREEWRLHDIERELLPIRGLLARFEAREQREALQAALPARGPGRPSKQALRERALAVQRLERQAAAEAADPAAAALARLGLDVPAVPKRSPGRPKTKRAYTARATAELRTPATEGTAYCVKCRDRRRLVYRRKVTLSNGRQALQGRCVDCGTKTRRITGTDQSKAVQSVGMSP